MEAYLVKTHNIREEPSKALELFQAWEPVHLTRCMNLHFEQMVKSFFLQKVGSSEGRPFISRIDI